MDSNTEQLQEKGTVGNWVKTKNLRIIYENGGFKVVPGEGLEPSYPKMRDFESRASTNFATPACWKAKKHIKIILFGNSFSKLI